MALILLFTIVPHAVTGDAYVRYLKLDALLREGSAGSAPYSLVGPIFAAPFWILRGTRLWWVAHFNVLVLAAGAAAAWLTLGRAMSSAERASAVLLLVATGMMPNATRDFYGEMFSSVMVGTGLLLITLHERRAGWIAVILGVVNMPASAVGLLLAAVHRLMTRRQSDGAVALAAASALILLENKLSRGAALAFGYAGNHGFATVLPFSGLPGFSYPLLLGVLSLLLSFGKGLLFFAPALLMIAHARRERPQAAPFLDTSVLFLAGLVLVYGKWWAWYGGWTWGPRYLLFASYPASVALAIALTRPGSARRAAATILMTLWTVWVGAAGTVFDLTGLDDCLANGYALEHLCWYVPEYSPVLRPLVLRPTAFAPWQVTWLVFAAVVFAVLITPGPCLERAAHGLRRALRPGPLRGA